MTFAALGVAAYAQKPAAGSITTEIGLTSLLGAPANPSTLNLNTVPAGTPIGMFRIRYFLSEGMAVRANLSFGSGKNVSVVDDDGLNPVVDKSEKTSKASVFGIAVGVEKHLAGTDKLSPYLGVELGFASQGGTDEVTNSNDGTTFTKGDSYSTSGGKTTSLAFNAMLGADYYIVEKVYFGAELGLGLFASQKTGEKEFKSTSGGTTVTGKTPEATASSFGLMPNVMGVIRLGIILN